MADETLKLDPKRTAMLIQDLQNDVIIEGGAFADSGAPAHATSQNVVANVKELAEAARSAGVPVIHIWYIVDEGATGLIGTEQVDGAAEAFEARLDGLR